MIIKFLRTWLGAATIVHLLAPEIIVLGGGLVEAMPELIIPRVSKVAKEQVLPNFVNSFKVVAAKLGDDATACGAAAWATSDL